MTMGTLRPKNERKPMKRALLLLATLVLAPLFAAQGGFEGGRPTHPLLLAGNGYFAIVNPDSSIAKRWGGGNNNDGWLLPNGHLLATDGTAWEADENGKRVWQYKATETKGGGVYACQRLPNGNTLIAENSTGTIFELSPSGERSNVIKVPLNEKNRHQTLRMVRRLPNGNTLVCRSGAAIVEIYDPAQKLVWSQRVPTLAFAAIQDAKGNVWVASLGQVQKWSPDHKLLWELKAAETGLPIKNMTGLHLLPNGNLIVGCYAYGKGVGAFEVTPEKKILWRYSSGKGSDSHMAVQLLDPAIATPNR